MKEILVGGLLSIQSYWDLRYKEIPSMISIIAGIVGICLWKNGERNIAEIICSFIPGIVCLACGKISREAIGYGDGILLCILGIYYTLEKLMEICLIAISAAGLWGLTLLILFHKKGKYEIPFVPFLLFGWIIQIIGTSGGI